MKIKARYIPWIILLVLFALLSLFSALHVLEKWELALYDNWFNLRGTEAPRDGIAVIGIDDSSVQKIGPWPWPKDVHARVLGQLKQAKAVTFDLVFDIPADAKADAAFGRAVADHGRVTMATMFTFKEEDGEIYAEILPPIPPLMDAVAATGFVNIPKDADNVVRGITPIDLNMFDRPFPALSIATLLIAQGKDLDSLEAAPDGIKAGDVLIPYPAGDKVLLNFYGPAGTFPTYSYVDVLEGKINPSVFKDRIVFIGPTSPLFHDEVNTPFTKGNMVLDKKLAPPGVEVHASAVETFLTGRVITRAPAMVNLAFLALVGILTLLLTNRRGPWPGLLLTILILGVTAGLAGFSWFKYRYWLNLAAPAILTFFTYAGVTVEGYVRTELDRRRTKALFGRYVSPTVVDELLTHPELVELGGKRQDVTIMFSDIRSFTAYSEGRPPEEVVSRLNEYLTEMTSVIFKYGGTLDKYMGDGLMALFGAPIPYADHAKRAVEAALEMQDRLAVLNKVWEERGEVTFRNGFGLSTGGVIVGNVGSPERMDYTVIGEDVNLASRLEGLNKEHKTTIIISHRTLNSLQATGTLEHISFIGLGQVPVRGFEEPIGIFTVVKEGRSPGSKPAHAS